MNLLKTRRTLAIMAKYWDRGRVKTRLAASLPIRAERDGAAMSDPDEIAATIHEQFVRHLLGGLRDCGDARELVGSPVERLDDFQVAAGGKTKGDWQVTDQGQGNLGERMHRWFSRHLFATTGFTQREAGSGPCVLIGADCPLISPADLDLAWSRLAEHDLVLGPAHDGGYYLIGFQADTGDAKGRLNSDSLAAIFHDIPWGTSKVLQRTLAAAEKNSLATTLLPPRHDVDNADDLQTLMQTLQESGDAEHPLLQTLSALEIRCGRQFRSMG